jgi:HSP20 family protein
VETKDAYRLEAEMPGVDKAGLDITLEANELTITGRRESYVTNGAALYRESQPHDYRRVFELDPAINTSNIKARMDQGVLSLELPKSEQVKPKKIAVTD